MSVSPISRKRVHSESPHEEDQDVTKLGLEIYIHRQKKFARDFENLKASSTPRPVLKPRVKLVSKVYDNEYFNRKYLGDETMEQSMFNSYADQSSIFVGAGDEEIVDPESTNDANFEGSVPAIKPESLEDQEMTEGLKRRKRPVQFEFPAESEAVINSGEVQLFRSRRHAWKSFAESLAEVLHDPVPLEYESMQFKDPLKIGAKIEREIEELFKTERRKYLNRVALRLMSLDRNPHLKYELMAGKMTPMFFATCHPFELATDELKNIRNEWIPEFVNQHYLPQDARHHNEMYRCGKCKSRNVSYFQLQMARADEGMTAICSCYNCGKRWKVQC